MFWFWVVVKLPARVVLQVQVLLIAGEWMLLLFKGGLFKGGFWSLFSFSLFPFVDEGLLLFCLLV